MLRLLLLLLACPASADFLERGAAAGDGLAVAARANAVAQGQAGSAALRAKPASCRPLEATGSFALTSGNVEYEITSRACPMDVPPPGFHEKVKEYFKPWPNEMPAPGYVVWAYEYSITNRGSADIEVSLSDWSFIHSPFTHLSGGFSVSVPAGKTYVLVFAALSEPEFAASPVNVGLRGTPGLYAAFSTVGAGKAGLYYPRYPLYLELKKGLVRSR